VRKFRGVVLLLLGLLGLWGSEARAYSLLTHEQLIDLTWKDSIVPLLLSRYPNLTPAELDQARAYAYGGCVIQDIGYYPFGDMNYSDLTHYVRSGDFVVNLFRDAKSANELAFAVGALSHYIGDSIGHPEATNLAVPAEFPKLRARFGRVVSYSEGAHQHVQAEFAFDINEVMHGRVAPLHYLRHIGLEVPVKQLSLAFYQTYGVGEDFTGKRGLRVNVRAYRFAVHTFIPRIAYAITILRRGRKLADPSTPDGMLIEKEAARVAQEDDWQKYRRKAGMGTYALAGLLFILPKIGPLRLVDVKGPTAATEADYMHSVAQSETALRRMLAEFTPPRKRQAESGGATEEDAQAQVVDVSAHEKNLATLPGARRDASIDPRHPLPNRDLDTGQVVKPGGYSLTDSTYAVLLHLLTRQPSEPVPPGIKEDILDFYSNPDAPIVTKKNPEQWAQVQADLVTLRGMPTNPEPQPFPTYGDEDGSTQ
jgi:hypothetical protein